MHDGSAECRFDISIEQRNLLWRLYLVLLILTGYGRMAERMLRDAGGFWSQFGPPLSATLLTVGIAYWLKGQPIATKWIWRFVHLVVCAAQAVGIIYAVFLTIISAYYGAALIFGAALLLIPSQYALHKYSYSSTAIWQARSRQADLVK